MAVTPTESSRYTPPKAMAGEFLHEAGYGQDLANPPKPFPLGPLMPPKVAAPPKVPSPASPPAPPPNPKPPGPAAVKPRALARREVKQAMGFRAAYQGGTPDQQKALKAQVRAQVKAKRPPGGWK